MCTGDNVLTARSIALQCGIYTAGGIIMEGPIFRQLERADLLEVVPRLQVLARSSPEDKKLLVETLRSLGEIVGVTGDGTNDGPALKTADVGFSMGIAGTEVAKEASDIILMDDNFASIVKAIMWGRCVNDAVRKFLQFQISTNVTAVIITFVSAVASASETSVLSAVQLLWINIIMDTFAALALATDPASPALLDRKPEKKTAPLFSVDMYKQIIGQSMYQTIVTLIFHFLGLNILGLTHGGDATLEKHNDAVVQTLVFNIFVFAQIFNSINSRRLDNRLNIFAGVTRNYYFMVITLIGLSVRSLSTMSCSSYSLLQRLLFRFSLYSSAVRPSRSRASAVASGALALLSALFLFLSVLSFAAFPTALSSGCSSRFASCRTRRCFRRRRRKPSGTLRSGSSATTSVRSRTCVADACVLPRTLARAAVRPLPLSPVSHCKFHRVVSFHAGA